MQTTIGHEPDCEPAAWTVDNTGPVEIGPPSCVSLPPAGLRHAATRSSPNLNTPAERSSAGSRWRAQLGLVGSQALVGLAARGNRRRQGARRQRRIGLGGSLGRRRVGRRGCMASSMARTRPCVVAVASGRHQSDFDRFEATRTTADAERFELRGGLARRLWQSRRWCRWRRCTGAGGSLTATAAAARTPAAAA